MISDHDSYNTYEYSKYYKILPQINNLLENKKYIKNGKKVLDAFTYKSNTNTEWMTKTELQNWIKNNQRLIENI